MFCRKCGTQIDNNAMVCPVCHCAIEQTESTTARSYPAKYHFCYGIYKRLPSIIAILYAIAVLVLAIVVGAEAGIGNFFLVALIGAILVAVVWFLASLFVAPKVVLIDTVLEIKKNMTKK